MRNPAEGKSDTVKAASPGALVSHLKLPFTIVLTALLLAFIAVIGVVRLFQSLNDGAISPWRLLTLFAHLFACVTILCALYGRGRSRPVGLAARHRRLP